MGTMVCGPCWMMPLTAMALYLCGSVPFGYVVAKLKGINIQEHGSGNIGATNVARVLGKPWGYLVFALDFLKSFLPLLTLAWLLRAWKMDDASSGLLLVGGLAAILGHNYTPWLGFKGGKGIATSAGVLAAILPWSLGVVLLVFVGVVAATRYISAGSVASSVALPVATYFLYPGQTAYLGFAVFAGALGVWRHRANLQRLWAGTEPKLGAKKTA